MSETRCPWCMEELADTTVCPACGHDAATYKPEVFHLPPNALIGGRYLIGGVLGQGGFGITYIGYDENLRRRVAIKEYFPIGHAMRMHGSPFVTSIMGERLDLFAGGRESFLSEARTMARVTGQPALVTVSDYFEANGTAYIIMDYVEGQSLAEVADERGGRIPFDELMELIYPVLDGLSVLHGTGLVHRDISPDNIMVSEGEACLIDFGCARDFLDAGGDERTMTVMLKYDYAAPEQYGRTGQGPWTDVYGLCATMYRCLCGEVPPRAIERLENDDIRRPSELGAEMPAAAERALMHGLEPRREARTQSMEELRDELSCEGGGRRIPAAVLPVAATICAIILAVAAFVVLRPREQQPVPAEDVAAATTTVQALTPERFQEAARRISAGKCHTLFLRDDGTVASTKVKSEEDDKGQTRVGDWEGVVQVACGGYHSVGVRQDGSVVACGLDDHGQCAVEGWKEVQAVSCGLYHTVGLNFDGTVVACGWNEYGQLDVGDWHDIVQVSASDGHTVGLRRDGTVVAVGYNDQGQCDVGEWTHIIAVSAGMAHTVGLTADGTVVSTDIVGADGKVDHGQTEVGPWSDIVGVSAGRWHTVGVRSDGTVVACGMTDNGRCNVSGWGEVEAACAGADHTVALLEDGTLKATGVSSSGQTNVDDLFA